MQLKWNRSPLGYNIDTNVFGVRYSVHLDGFEFTWIVANTSERKQLARGFETMEEAMVAAHQIIEKELEKGYVRKEAFNSLPAKLSYIHEDMFGCKKALSLFTNENGDEYIDSALISATIPKGSLVREVDPEHHNDLPGNGICRKCRSDRAIIVDILEPMCVRPGESINLPSRKTQRKKMPIISVHIVTEALRKYFTAQESVYDYYMCTIMRKLISGFMSVILGYKFPASLDLMIAARLLEPYEDVVYRYQNDPYMFCKVLLARILRDMGIMDIALRQSYKIGNKIQIDNFDLSNNACGAGFHFFKTAIEAWNYKFN